MTQIFSGTDIVGKTIKKVFGDEKLFLVFTDDTFCCIRGYGTDEDVTIDTENINLTLSYYNIFILSELGLITDKQRSDIINEENLRRKNHQSQVERAEFERLKKKYG